MEKKKIAIAYLRFDAKDSKRYKKSVKEVVKIIMDKEGYKIIGFIEDCVPTRLGIDVRALRLVERLNSGEFFGARHIVTIRRETFGSTEDEIDYVIKTLIQHNFNIYGFLDNDINDVYDKNLMFQDAIAKVMFEWEA